MTRSVFRIASTSPSYNYDDLTGKGAEMSGGRWNRKGMPVVYTASSVALAALETIVHTDTSAWPLNRYVLEIAIPDALWAAAEDAEKLGTLPKVWDSQPAPKETLDFGDEWIASRRSLLLIVPSVIVPQEANILINPQHAGAAEIRIIKTTRFVYDSRIRP
ncbi:MAG: RES family NAD+ phosphorylase [Asticcacaulis sp.]|nr:RES family NAD+ phosphorylase [Asticcacaulis sp.]